MRLKVSPPLFAAAADYLARMNWIAAPIDLVKVDVYSCSARSPTARRRWIAFASLKPAP